MKKVFALIIAVIMLTSLVILPAGAEDDINWEAVTNYIGMNIYIGDKVTVKPEIDGVISDGEYPYDIYNSPSEIYQYSLGEIQSGVTEYFAHDADYIYYAVEFVQENDNRAFQWMFKPFDTFDIFRGNQDMTKYYYTRVSWQARHKVDDEGYYTDYFGSYGPTINDSCVRVPTASGAETDELYCVSGKNTETNVKVYEVKLAKSYLAEINNCENDDIRTIPYFTYFHSVAGLGHIYTEDDLLVISDADYSVFLPSANELGFRFIVLAETTPPPPPHTHSWDKGVVTVAATHTSYGIKTFTCKSCGDTYTDYIDPLPDHQYSWSQHNATEHMGSCDCGYYIYGEHLWDEGTTLLEPTEDDRGIMLYACLACGEIKLLPIDRTLDVETDENPEEDKTTTSNLQRPAAMQRGCRVFLGGGAALISGITLLGAVLVTKRKENG